MPLIGLTATPYRLQGGWLHQGPDAWFSDIAYEIGVAELIEQGYLAPLTGRKPSAATIEHGRPADRARRLPRERPGRAGRR